MINSSPIEIIMKRIISLFNGVHHHHRADHATEMSHGNFNIQCLRMVDGARNLEQRTVCGRGKLDSLAR